MKILHVIGDFNPRSGGTVAAVSGMAQAQSQLGHRVSIATTKYAWKDRYRIEGVDFFVYDCNFPKWRWSWGLMMNLSRLIRSVDVVHVHGVWEFPIWWASVLCGFFKKPFILTPHGMLDRSSLSKSYWKKRVYMTLLGYQVLKGSRAIHFTSSGELKHSGYAEASKSVCAPLGLLESFYEKEPDPEAFKRRFSRFKGHQLVLFLGRVHAKKQPDLLIKAFSNISHDFPDALLIIVGPGERSYVNQLKKLSEFLGIRQRVVFIGMLQGEIVKEAYRAAEVFVLPSLQENFGFTIVEALAMACPVILSPSVNLAEEIQQASAGFITELDENSLSSTLRKSLTQSGLLRQMGENGKKYVLENFKWDKTILGILGVYTRVLSEHHS